MIRRALVVTDLKPNRRFRDESAPYPRSRGLIALALDREHIANMLPPAEIDFSPIVRLLSLPTPRLANILSSEAGVPRQNTLTMPRRRGCFRLRLRSRGPFAGGQLRVDRAAMHSSLRHQRPKRRLPRRFA